MSSCSTSRTSLTGQKIKDEGLPTSSFRSASNDDDIDDRIAAARPDKG